MLDEHPRAGVLRVLVLPDRMPFAFQNREGQLVGMDVELAQALAADLGGRRPVLSGRSPTRCADLLAAGAGDIAMSGVAVTPDRAAGTLFSHALSRRDAGVRDARSAARSLPDLGRDPRAGRRPRRRAGRSGVPARRRARAPRSCELVPLRQAEDQFLTGRDEVMAYVLPAERGSVLTLLHPAYSVVVPQPDTIKLPVAYPLARSDERWVTFVNTWLELKRRDGTIDALYRHWILGEHAAVRSRDGRSYGTCCTGWSEAYLNGIGRQRSPAHPVQSPSISRAPKEHVRLQKVEPRRGQALRAAGRTALSDEGHHQRRLVVYAPKDFRRSVSPAVAANSGSSIP